jgi:hypothetical protein
MPQICGFDERQFHRPALSPGAIDEKVMIMTEGANSRLYPPIVTAGSMRFAGSMEDTTARALAQSSEIADGGGGLPILKSNGVRRPAP